MKNISLIFLTLTLLLNSCGTSTSKRKSNSKTDVNSTKLAEQNFEGEYTLENNEFGTKTYVIINSGNRNIKTNGLPNHETGTFPNKGNPNTITAQDLNYTIPLAPKLSGESRWAREPGVALNGVKFEPETAERFVCETGEVYKIETFQELVDLGLDFNHAHVQPTGAYHYHGVPIGLIKVLDKGEDVILVGFAKDGFPIYYSKSGIYKPSYQLSEKTRTGDACSYKTPKTNIEKELKNTEPDGTFVSDWTYNEKLGDLDECNGITYQGNYSYFITDEYPYIGRCLKGLFEERGPKGPPPGGRGHSHGGQPHKH